MTLILIRKFCQDPNEIQDSFSIGADERDAKAILRDDSSSRVAPLFVPSCTFICTQGAPLFVPHQSFHLFATFMALGRDGCMEVGTIRPARNHSKDIPTLFRILQFFNYL